MKPKELKNLFLNINPCNWFTIDFSVDIFKVDFIQGFKVLEV